MPGGGETQGKKNVIKEGREGWGGGAHWGPKKHLLSQKD